jgi:Ca-activated chloride channel homolog
MRYRKYNIDFHSTKHRMDVRRFGWIARMWILALMASAVLRMHAQITILPQVVSFGTITRDTPQEDKTVDVLITNRGEKPELILRATFGFEFETRLTSKTIAPDSTVVLRIRFNPREKRLYNERGELWLASAREPLLIPVKAEVMYVNVNENLPCPSFGERPAECCASNMYVVVAQDEVSGAPIAGAKVAVSEDGVLQKKLATNVGGRVTQDMRIGYYSVTVSAEGYDSKTVTGYINKNNNEWLFALRKIPGGTLSLSPLQDTVVATAPSSVMPLHAAGDTSLLSTDLFKPNNIVFLLDISGSMALGDKLLMMQQSMEALLSVLRPEDRVAIVSYAGDAKVIMASTSAAAKEDMIALVNALHAQGRTAGAIGFKKAYRLVRKSAISGGNNQLFVITDGAFQPTDQPLIQKEVRKSARRGVVTSVVGIQCNEVGKEKLRAVAEAGFGSFLSLEEQRDVRTLLVDDIKKHARK